MQELYHNSTRRLSLPEFRFAKLQLSSEGKIKDDFLVKLKTKSTQSIFKCGYKFDKTSIREVDEIQHMEQSEDVDEVASLSVYTAIKSVGVCRETAAC